MREVKKVSRTGLTKDLINKYSIPYGSKHFSLGGSQNYLVFQSLSTYFTS